jgi:hypothetical protein
MKELQFLKQVPRNYHKSQKQLLEVSLPVVLYGFEILSFALREEHRFRVFENRGLRRISEYKRDEVTGGWRKLHNEGLHNLYSSPNITY